MSTVMSVALALSGQGLRTMLVFSFPLVAAGWLR
jgi:hypothetical protein